MWENRLNRIIPNFVCMEIYLIGTYAEILDKFYKIVFSAKFDKVVNMGDQDSRLCFKMSVSGETLTHF